MNDGRPGKRPILYDYFKTSANVLLAEYERSKDQEASANIAHNREMFCTKFLRRILPARLAVERGEIWDSQGNRTGQLEVVIVRNDTPSLVFGESNTFLAEGVFGVVEVKSNLSVLKLREALAQLDRVKGLDFSCFGSSSSMGPSLKRPLCCVFAFDGATLGTLHQEVGQAESSDTADLICVLKRGALISRSILPHGLVTDRKSDSPFWLCEGTTASLAMLYYVLSSYSTGFMGRAFRIEQYFKPFGRWCGE